MRKPNFFIVGAPKCGTTALQDYLVQHPDIYMPQVSEAVESIRGGKRELHFFGSDLAFRRPSPEEYLNYFAAATTEKCVGEASVWYLYSQQAAAEMQAFAPDARVIIMLRNPVDMIYSLHSELLFYGDEEHEDFAAAIAAEPLRQQQSGLVKGKDHPIECFYYREVAKYARQVKRYFDTFGRDRVCVIIFDDFRQNLPQTYQNTLEFLGVDPNFTAEFQVINSNKRIRNRALQNFLRRPPKIIKIAKKLLPSSLRQGVRAGLERSNVQQEARSPLNAELQQQLRAEFVSEVEQLSDLLNRDLTAWSREPEENKQPAAVR